MKGSVDVKLNISAVASPVGITLKDAMFESEVNNISTLAGHSILISIIFTYSCKAFSMVHSAAKLPDIASCKPVLVRMIVLLVDATFSLTD